MVNIRLQKNALWKSDSCLACEGCEAGCGCIGMEAMGDEEWWPPIAQPKATDTPDHNLRRVGSTQLFLPLLEWR